MSFRAFKYIYIVKRWHQGNHKQVSTYSQNTNTNFPELVIAMKDQSEKNPDCWFRMFCVSAYYIILYITVIKNGRARARLHCPVCEVVRSFESFGGFNSETSVVYRECLQALLSLLGILAHCHIKLLLSF